MNELQIMNIEGIECYEKDGIAYLKLETVARGLGFTKTETKNGTEYITIRWERVFGFLDEIGFDHKWAKDGYIPENIFYRLAMKAKNAVAEAFQAKIADEVIPAIRKTGTYGLPKDYPSALRALADETERHQQAQADLEKAQNREREMAQLVAMTLVGADTRKANYYDELVDKNLLTSIRETANLLKVQEKEFVRWMIAGKFLYRGKRDRLRPYANRIEEGLFELKETSDDGTGRARVQTLVTPKGRETFLRLMNKGVFRVLFKPINIMDYIK